MNLKRGTKTERIYLCLHLFLVTKKKVRSGSVMSERKNAGLVFTGWPGETPWVPGHPTYYTEHYTAHCTIHWTVYCSESVLWWEEGYTMKFSLSLGEILRAKPKGFLKSAGYISFFIPTWVTIQTFPITIPALTFLESNIGRVDSPYRSNSWAIREKIVQLIEQH